MVGAAGKGHLRIHGINVWDQAQAAHAAAAQQHIGGVKEPCLCSKLMEAAAAAADGRSRAMGRKFPPHPGQLEQRNALFQTSAFGCGVPVPAVGSRQVSPSRLLRLNPALDLPVLLCLLCAAVISVTS